MAWNVDPAFASVADTLEQIVVRDGRGGAGVCVYHHGRVVVDHWCGTRDEDGTQPWEGDTLAMSFSTTKGVTATALHMCVDRGLLDYDDRVMEHWPEFGQNGKEGITVRQILCHEAGLHPVAPLVEDAHQMNDWDHMVRGLERAVPSYEPGTMNGYHGLTYGWLVGELVRRVSGRSLGTFVRDEIAGPLGLHGLFIGVTPEAEERLATLLEGSHSAVDADGLAAAGLVEILEQMGLEFDPQHLVDAIMPPGIAEWTRSEETPRAEVPSANGCFDARSLARMYAALAAGGTLDGVTLLSRETLERAIEVQNTRPDLVIGLPMQWRLGYHGVFTPTGMPPRAFGHYGFGGSGAFADLDTELALGFTVNRLGGATQGDERIIRLATSALEAARS